MLKIALYEVAVMSTDWLWHPHPITLYM